MNRNWKLLVASAGLSFLLNGQGAPMDSPILVVDSSVHVLAGKKFVKVDSDKHQARFHLSGNRPISIDMWDTMGHMLPSRELSGANWHIASGNSIFVFAAAKGDSDYEIRVLTPGDALTSNRAATGVDQPTIHFAPASVFVGSNPVVNDVAKVCIHYCPASSCRLIACPVPDDGHHEPPKTR
jgi:hypothetical protein